MKKVEFIHVKGKLARHTAQVVQQHLSATSGLERELLERMQQEEHYTMIVETDAAGEMHVSIKFQESGGVQAMYGPCYWSRLKRLDAIASLLTGCAGSGIS